MKLLNKNLVLTASLLLITTTQSFAMSYWFLKPVNGLAVRAVDSAPALPDPEEDIWEIPFPAGTTFGFRAIRAIYGRTSSALPYSISSLDEGAIQVNIDWTQCSFGPTACSSVGPITVQITASGPDGLKEYSYQKIFTN